jgi:hypothetical protein
MGGPRSPSGSAALSEDSGEFPSPNYDSYSESIGTSAQSAGGWQRLYYEDPASLKVVNMRLRSFWDYDFKCVTESVGLGTANWYLETGWKKALWTLEAQWSGSCARLDHVNYGAFYTEQWCRHIGTVSVEISLRNTIDATGGFYVDYNTWKDAPAACGTIWPAHESGR